MQSRRPHHPDVVRVSYGARSAEEALTLMRTMRLKRMFLERCNTSAEKRALTL